MKRFKKLLVATATRLEKHPVIEEAAMIALSNAASLTIVDVVPELSWTAILHAWEMHDAPLQDLD